jgi:hypothetical protein
MWFGLYVLGAMLSSSHVALHLLQMISSNKGKVVVC